MFSHNRESTSFSHGPRRWLVCSLSLCVGMVLFAASGHAAPQGTLYPLHKRSQASHTRSLLVRVKVLKRQGVRVARLAVKRRGLRKLDLRPRLSLRRRLGKKKRRVASAKAAQDGRETKNLAQVYAMAKQHNVDLKLLKQRLKRAEIARARSWVGLHPTVGVSGSYTRNQQEVAFNGAVITPLNQLSLGLQVNWTFLNLAMIPQVQGASLGKQQTKILNAQTQRDLYFSVARGYYNVLLSQGAVDIARQSRLYAKANLRHAMLRKQAGVAAPIRLSQARLDMAQAQQSLQSAQSSLTNARLALALLLGRATFPYMVQQPGAPVMPQGAPTNWRNDARRKRKELHASRLGVKIQEAKLRQAWLTMMPTAGANAGLQLSNATGFSGQNTQWSAGLSLQWQLYHGNHALGVRDGHVGLRQAKLELKKQEQVVDNDVRTAWNNLQNARRAVVLANKSAKLARQTLTLQQQLYRSGTATPLAVSDALNKSYAAQISYLRETLNAALAVLGLQRAVGSFSSVVNAQATTKAPTRLVRR